MDRYIIMVTTKVCGGEKVYMIRTYTLYVHVIPYICIIFSCLYIYGMMADTGTTPSADRVLVPSLASPRLREKRKAAYA